MLKAVEGSKTKKVNVLNAKEAGLKSLEKDANNKVANDKSKIEDVPAGKKVDIGTLV